MAAKRTWFSPAGPMASTSVPPSVSVMVSHVSRIHFPLRWARVLERHSLLGEHEIDERVRLAVQDDRVVAGALERDGPGAAEGGVEEQPGERADGGGARAARAGDCGIRIGPHGEDDNVFRRQRVGAGFQVVPEYLGAESVSPQELAAHFLAEFLDARRAVA